MEEILKWAKELGVPLACVVACLYFYAAKIIPAQHQRDKEKDEGFIANLKEMTSRTESQTKLFIESQRSMLDTFRAEAEENRKQDQAVREHHKQVIEAITNQTRESLDQNSKWLNTTQANHNEIREDLKSIKSTIDMKFDQIIGKLK